MLLLQIEGLEVDQEKQQKKKFYEKRSFWTFRVPLVWVLVFVFIGVMLRIYDPLRVCSSEIQALHVSRSLVWIAANCACGV